MKRKLQWVLFNGLFATAVYFAFFEQIEGALKLVSFFTTVIFILSFFMLNEDIKKKMAEKGKTFPFWVDGVYDITIISIFAWHNAFYLAAAYTIYAIIYNRTWQSVLEKKKEIQMNNNGFTLIELLIVMALIGIIGIGIYQWWCFGF